MTEKPVDVEYEEDCGKPFDWRTGTDALVFRSVAALAIYLNPEDDVVIRQKETGEDQGHGDYSDSVVVIPREKLNDVITALQLLCDK